MLHTSVSQGQNCEPCTPNRLNNWFNLCGRYSEPTPYRVVQKGRYSAFPTNHKGEWRQAHRATWWRNLLVSFLQSFRWTQWQSHCDLFCLTYTGSCVRCVRSRFYFNQFLDCKVCRFYHEDHRDRPGESCCLDSVISKTNVHRGGVIRTRVAFGLDSFEPFGVRRITEPDPTKGPHHREGKLNGAVGRDVQALPKARRIHAAVPIRSRTDPCGGKGSVSDVPILEVRDCVLPFHHEGFRSSSVSSFCF